MKFRLILLACFLVVSANLFAQQSQNLIPTPSFYLDGDGEFTLCEKIKIGFKDKELEPAARYLAGILNRTNQTKYVRSNKNTDVYLNLEANLYPEGGYKLEINSKQITLESSSYEGVLNGISTIRQLLPISYEIEHNTQTLKISNLVIKDYPKFNWRGLMLDSSRHFWTTVEVKKVLDLMALYKLNKFHWHLTDDQGWRIEIKKYPLLTENGSWRKFNDQDRACIAKAVELDNKSYLIPEDRIKVVKNDTLYGGYYSQEEIKDIITYAAQRGIEVIPEIDMPGHFLAAIEEYPEIGCNGLIGWGSFFSSPICVGKDSTIEFCKNILTEVFDLFPSQFIHIGGDEVDKTNWGKCKDCQTRIVSADLESVEELQAWFLKEIESYVLKHNRRLIGWDEIVDDGLTDRAVIMWWRENYPSAIPSATLKNQNAINTSNEFLYFDYDQTSETLRDILAYNPIPANMTLAQEEKVLGVQANLWTEWIASFERLEYMLVPRIFALSELAWVEKSKMPSLGEFYAKIQDHFKRMDVLNVNYKIPDLESFYDLNTFVSDTIVEISSPLENTEIRYTLDGTVPNKRSLLYEGAIVLKNSADLSFRTYRIDGTSSDIYYTKYLKIPYFESVVSETVTQGLKLSWYDFRGESCNEIEKAALLKNMIVENVQIPEEARIPDGKPGHMGLIFKGYIDIQETGIYTFSLMSDDGSLLKIHDQLIIDNDGSHYPEEKTAQVPLKKGLHPIEVRYFDVDGGELSFRWIINKNRVKIDNLYFKN